MTALCWHGKHDMRCDSVSDPTIEHPRDAIIKVTSCAICGSDLHMYDGLISSMESGDVVGHETMGEVVEVGSENKKLKVGDRVVVPFTIACGECFCKRGFFSGCERSNPNAKDIEKLWRHSPAGLFGYSHMLGGFAGAQADYLRVPYADIGPMKLPDGLTDDQVLFLSDIFPTGYMAAGFCNIKKAPSGAATRSASLRSAGPFCLAPSGSSRSIRCPSASPWPKTGAITIDFEKEDVYERIQELTKGRGADACIDAVGTEAETMASADSLIDRIKVATVMGIDRPHVLKCLMPGATATYSLPRRYARHLSARLPDERDLFSRRQVVGGLGVGLATMATAPAFGGTDAQLP